MDERSLGMGEIGGGMAELGVVGQEQRQAPVDAQKETGSAGVTRRALAAPLEDTSGRKRGWGRVGLRKGLDPQNPRASTFSRDAPSDIQVLNCVQKMDLGPCD